MQRDQADKERQVRRCEVKEIAPLRNISALCDELIAYETRHRSDQGAKPAQVCADDQRLDLVREAGKQDGSGNVAHDLACRNGGEHLVSGQDAGKGAAEPVDPAQVPDEDKKAKEGPEQGIVHLPDGAPVRDADKGQDCRERHGPGGDAGNRREAQKEEDDVGRDDAGLSDRHGSVRCGSSGGIILRTAGKVRALQPKRMDPDPKKEND